MGLQLHTVREALLFDPGWALEQVAAAGYHLAELSCHDAAHPSECLGMSSAVLGQYCHRAGLRLTGGKVSGLDLGNVDQVIAFYNALGAEYIVVAIGYFPDAAALAGQAALYNRLAERCSRSGLKFYYAHHYHELQRLGGRPTLELLLEQTDPALVGLQFNPYWLMRGLADPMVIFKQVASRAGLIELQDFPLQEIDKLNMWEFYRHHPLAANIRWDSPLKGGEIENIHPVQCHLFTEVGSGIVKVQETLDLANCSGRVRYVMLRQDFSRRSAEMDSLRLSQQNVAKLRGVQWS